MDPPTSSGPAKKRKRADVEDPSEAAETTATYYVGGSNDLSAFSLSTKQKVLELDGEECWFCGASPPRIAHVIEQRDRGVSL